MRYMNYFKAMKRIVDIRLNYEVKNYDDHFFKKLREEIENTDMTNKKTVLRMAEEIKRDLKQ